MSSEDDDESGPPPARHDTGTFAHPNLNISVSTSTALGSPSTLSPTAYSSFRWDRAQSFRLYAVNSRSVLRRNTSFGLGSSVSHLGASQNGSENSPASPGSGVSMTSDDAKMIVKSCYNTLKSFILAHGALTAVPGAESTLPSNLRKGPSVGSGGYATVYCGVNTTTGELVAIKEIQVSGNKATNPLAFQSVQEEFALLRKLRHKNIIQYQLFEYSISQKLCRIVMEFCAGGSALEMLHKFGTLPEVILKQMAIGMFSGLDFIHGEGIIHRDIKPANILMHANGVVKLADFGCSKRIGEISETTSHVLGTPVYMAPEYIKGRIHRKSDIWSVGCTLLELVTGKPPWHHTKLRDHLAQMFHISTTLESPQIPYADISNEMSEFLARCFDRNVETRPEARELLSHPWLTRHSQEDTEGILAIEEMGADQFSMLVEQLCVEPQAGQPPPADKPVILASPKQHRDSQMEECLALSGMGSGHLRVGNVVSTETSRVNTPEELSIELPEAAEPLQLPTGPVHMELPIELPTGRTMKLELDVKPEDLSVKVLGRRKSYVVNLTDGIRDQIHQALQMEAAHASQSQTQFADYASSHSSPQSNHNAEPTGW